MHTHETQSRRESCVFSFSHLILIIILIIIIIIVIVIVIIIIIIISNSNWTEWSTIQRAIARVISKSEADLTLRARLLPELYDTRSNY